MALDYGYLWYVKDERDETRDRLVRTYSAAGIGGQKILLIPDLDLVLVATARTSLFRDRGTHLNATVGKALIPAVRDRR